MPKVATMILTTVSGMHTGVFFSGLLKQRQTALRKISDILQQAGVYIRYNHLRLSEIFAITDEARFLFSDNLIEVTDRGISIEEEWEKCVNSVQETLGKSDTNGQLAVIEGVREQLACCIETAREDYNRKGRLYRTLGILAGAAVGIIAL